MYLSTIPKISTLEATCDLQCTPASVCFSGTWRRSEGTRTTEDWYSSSQASCFNQWSGRVHRRWSWSYAYSGCCREAESWGGIWCHVNLPGGTVMANLMQVQMLDITAVEKEELEDEGFLALFGQDFKRHELPQWLLHCFRRNKDTFSQSDLDLGGTDVAKHPMRLDDHSPFKERGWRVPHTCMRRCANTYIRC